ncbi:MAG: hypothetical protein GWP17_06480 [Aquificales bacterium]|nr:hypothetical protein [Aquificales bacterium]
MAKKRFGSGKKLSISKPTSERGMLRQSSQWPLHECLITAEWQKPTQLIQICVTRKAPSGEIAVGSFLVDLACLGVKNAYGRMFHSQRQYKEELRDPLINSQEMTTCDVDMAAKIIEEGVNYANSLGFKPQKDIKYAYLVLGETHPENYADLEVPLGGEDGKPFLIAGPYDDVDRLMRILNRKVGEGNYTFIVPIHEPGFLDDEDWDDMELLE